METQTKNGKTYKIVDAESNEVLTTIDQPLLNFIYEIQYVISLYEEKRYTMAGNVKEGLKEKLDDLVQ